MNKEWFINKCKESRFKAFLVHNLKKENETYRDASIRLRKDFEQQKEAEEWKTK